MSLLNEQNYSKGFLVDDDLMAGITHHPENSNQFIAFILHHTTGEYLGYQPFTELGLALQAINRIPRSWSFEAIGGCGNCGEKGGCSTGACGVGDKPCKKGKSCNLKN